MASLISSKLQTEATPLIDGKRFENKFYRVVDGIGKETAIEFEPQVQQAFQPFGDVQYPIEWQTERQRRAFFATDGFGQGIPTQRTGEHTKAWELVWLHGDKGAGVFILQNKKKASKFIFGGLRRGNRLQQRMHKGTWPDAVDQKDRLFESVLRIAGLKFKEALGSFGVFGRR